MDDTSSNIKWLRDKQHFNQWELLQYRLLLLCMVLSVSQALSPYPYLVAFIILTVLALKRIAAIRAGYFFLAAATLIAGLAGVFINFEINTSIRVVSVCAIFLMFSSSNLQKQTAALDTVLRFVNISLLLCLIGFIYAALGGQHVWAVQNPDGRQALLYLTTLSNSVFPSPTGGVIIRPSFVFDEPGAYAFVIDAVLLASFILNRRIQRQEWTLIIGGMLTFSMAHMVVVVCIFFAAGLIRYSVLPIFLLAAVDYWVYTKVGISLFFSRLKISGGVLVGDNRSALFKNALDIISNFPEGVGPLCKWKIMSCYQSFGTFGDNPAFPAAYFGIFNAMAFYIILLVLMLRSVASFQRQAFFVGIAIVGLISQRPYLFNLGYNLLIIFLFFLYCQCFRVQLSRRLR